MAARHGRLHVTAGLESRHLGSSDPSVGGREGRRMVAAEPVVEPVRAEDPSPRHARSTSPKGPSDVETLPTDHAGLAVLPRTECLDRLRHARVGRVAFVENGEPVILPVNHEIDGETIVFRTASGSKLAAAASESRVAFEVDGFDVDRRAGWSVVVRGVAVLITDDEEVRRLRALGVWPWARSAGIGSGCARTRSRVGRSCIPHLPGCPSPATPEPSDLVTGGAADPMWWEVGARGNLDAWVPTRTGRRRGRARSAAARWASPCRCRRCEHC